MKLVFLALLLGPPALTGGRAVVSFAAPAVEARAGSTTEASLSFEIDEGYHVQAHPASNELLIAAELTLEPGCGIKPGKPVYPKGEPYRLEGSDDALSTYAGTFVIRVPLRVKRSARSGSCTLTGRLHFQACDTKTCLFPADLAFDLPVVIR